MAGFQIAPMRITGPVLKVLRELLERPAAEISGAEVSKAIGVPSGTLYPILFRLEKAGWVTSRWERSSPTELGRPRRRLYRMTAEGQKAARVTFREILPSEGDLQWQF